MAAKMSLKTTQENFLNLSIKDIIKNTFTNLESS